MWPWRKRASQTSEPVERVVDDRVLLTGLDDLYRQVMKEHEAGDLLRCARAVAAALGEYPDSSVPIEGYYAENAALTEYFRLVRSLQRVDVARRAEVSSLPEFQRLLAVATSPHLAATFIHDGLLPLARDALAIALNDTPAPQWSISTLVEAAARAASHSDDCSLVGMAAFVRDPVLIAATRETAVLYAEVAFSGGLPRPETFRWAVSATLVERASRFVQTVNTLLQEHLPVPSEGYAEVFWRAAKRSSAVGRCARVGQDLRRKDRHYHWAIKLRGAELVAEDFWDAHVWTTSTYRQANPF